MTESAGSTLSVVDADKSDIDWLIATYLDAAGWLAAHTPRHYPGATA